MESLRDEILPAAELHLNTIVKEIRWGRRQVEIVAQTGVGRATTFRAAQAVITLPVGVLKASLAPGGPVCWKPELPADKRAALDALVMGPVVKVLLEFDEPFWFDRGCEQAGFFQAPAEPIPTWWTTMPLRAPRLVGWAGGPKAGRLAKLSDAQILERAMATLGNMFGVTARELNGRTLFREVCNWPRDPFALGAYSYIVTGGVPAALQLAEPVERTLFFAGEAACPKLNGTVAGALASGMHAAEEVLKNE